MLLPSSVLPNVGQGLGICGLYLRRQMEAKVVRRNIVAVAKELRCRMKVEARRCGATKLHVIVVAANLHGRAEVEARGMQRCRC